MNARIRTVKPSVFMHSLLYDIGELTGFGALAYLGYIGLWCWTDREARFEWKPRELKLGILPHYAVDYGLLLNAYANTGMIVKYQQAGRVYGWLPRFLDHQNINGRETESVLPAPPQSAIRHYESLLLVADFHTCTRDTLLAEPVLCDSGGPAQQTGRTSFVYYMRHAGHVKIGTSTDPWQRLAALRTARPALKLVGLEHGTEALERVRHEQFRHSRIAGDREWFRWSPEISDHIAAHCSVNVSSSDRTTQLEDFVGHAVSDSNDNDLTRGSPDTLGREGKGREGKGREGRTDTASSAMLNGAGADRAGSILSPQHRPACEQGASEPESPANGQRDVVLAISGPLSSPANGHKPNGAGLAVVVDSARNVPALPAVRGIRTATAVQERMATVLSEIANGERSRMKQEQLHRLNAELVFIYWTARFGHPKAILDDKREARIIARLKENDGDVSELLYALDGAARDEHIMGGTSGRKFDGIETVLRDRGQVERFANTRRGFRDGTPHKALVKLEAAARGEAPQEETTP